jgi:Peptidase family M23
MTPIYIAQLIIPLLLVLWLLLIPPKSYLGFAIQVIGSILILFALKRIGIWLFPPWWTPYVAAILVAMVAMWIWFHRTPQQLLPSGKLAWLSTSFFVMVSVVSAFYGTYALIGVQAPLKSSVSLAWPLHHGNFLIANGGSNTIINHHYKLKDTKNPRFINWQGGSYALDIVAIDKFGLRAKGFMPANPARYHIFGMPLLAPCAGKVFLAVDGLPDMQVPELDSLHLAGNYIFLACGDVYILMAHLKRGSLLVKAGDAVNIGQAIGMIGNSGNSDEPHLHLQAQRFGSKTAPFSGEPLAMTFDGRFPVRGDRIVGL